MAYAPHTLFVMAGSLTDPNSGQKDIWQCSVRGVQVDSPDRPVTDPVAFMNGIATPLATYFASADSQICAYASLDYIKVNNIGADGKYSDKSNTNQHDYSPIIQGTGTNGHPFTESFAYSWRTTKARGPGSHGRIYLPNASQGAAGSATIAPAVQAVYLTAAQQLLHILNVGDGDTAGMLPVVASNVNATNTPVTSISIGRVIDSQRRRRNALTEAYISGPAFPG